MHTAKAPPMEIAEDVRRVMRVPEKRTWGSRRILPLPSAILATGEILREVLGFRRERERKLRFLFFPLFDSWNNFLNFSFALVL